MRKRGQPTRDADRQELERKRRERRDGMYHPVERLDLQKDGERVPEYEENAAKADRLVTWEGWAAEHIANADAELRKVVAELDSLSESRRKDYKARDRAEHLERRRGELGALIWLIQSLDRDLAGKSPEVAELVRCGVNVGIVAHQALKVRPAFEIPVFKGRKATGGHEKGGRNSSNKGQLKPQSVEILRLYDAGRNRAQIKEAVPSASASAIRGVINRYRSPKKLRSCS